MHQNPKKCPARGVVWFAGDLAPAELLLRKLGSRQTTARAKLILSDLNHEQATAHTPIKYQ